MSNEADRYLPYLDHAEIAFKNLYSSTSGSGYFQQSGNFWQLGNTFDSMTSYLKMVSGGGLPSYADGFLAEALKQYYTCNLNGSANWFDDYCWWGIAGSKAFDSGFDTVFGASKADFQQAALDMFGVAYAGDYGQLADDIPPSYYTGAKVSEATLRGWADTRTGSVNVWERANSGQYAKYFNTPGDSWAVPRFSKTGTVGGYQGELNDSDNDPSSAPLGAFENTVMNGLVWCLAARLVQLDTSAPAGCGTCSTREYDFFAQWFDLDDGTGLLTSDHLVNERVSTYAKWDGNHPFTRQWLDGYPTVFNWNADRVWTGDQGLVLSSLVDYVAANSNAAISSRIVPLLEGVNSALVDGGKVLVPFIGRGPLHHTSDWYDDYQCGTGTFMRHLLQAFDKNTDVRRTVWSWVTGSPGDNIILNTANKALDGDQAESDLWKNFNILSILTAATQILKWCDAHPTFPSS